MKKKNCTRYYSSQQEKDVAKVLGGKVQSNSGAGKFQKGDVIVSKNFLADCKTSIEEKKSFSVKKKDFEKIRDERISMGCKYEALVHNFGSGTENLYTISERAMKDFVALLKESEE